MQTQKTKIKNHLPEGFLLSHGGHTTREEGMCLMEAVAFLAGEKHSASPKCACPQISSFGIRANDAIYDDVTRTRALLPLAEKIVGTKSTKAVEKRRSFIAVDVAIREVAPLWLEAHPELAHHAAKLRALPEIVDAATLEQGFAVRDAARAAAWDVRRKATDGLAAKIKAALPTLAKPEGLSDQDWKIAAAAAAAVAAAAVAAAAEAAVAAAAAAAVAAAAVAAAAEAAVVVPRHPGESDGDYYWRLRNRFWSYFDYPKLRQIGRDAIREKHGDLIAKTHELNAKCLDRMIACTEAA
jgi:hypothetical protein